MDSKLRSNKPAYLLYQIYKYLVFVPLLVVSTIRKAKATIKNRTGIMFMAEGTRSASGKLRKFKKGAFRFALDIDLPILPVTIAGTKDILPKNTMDLFPGRACMTIHAPIDVRGYDVETIDKLISITRKAILKGL